MVYLFVSMPGGLGRWGGWIKHLMINHLNSVRVEKGGGTK